MRRLTLYVRVVLDANLLISALITKGTPPDNRYQAWLNGEIEVVMTAAQIAEIRDVLVRPRLKRFIHTDEAVAIVENIDAYVLVLVDAPGGWLLSQEFRLEWMISSNLKRSEGEPERGFRLLGHKIPHP